MLKGPIHSQKEAELAVGLKTTRDYFIDDQNSTYGSQMLVDH